MICYIEEKTFNQKEKVESEIMAVRILHRWDEIRKGKSWQGLTPINPMDDISSTTVAKVPQSALVWTAHSSAPVRSFRD